MGSLTKIRYAFIGTVVKLKKCIPVLLYPFLKISSFSCLIFDYKIFGGDFLLSHFSVNDSCYGSDGRAKESMRE
jgi:hypothetical protein